VSQATYEAAVKACGGAGPSPAITKAEAAFSECMRANGVHVPAGKSAPLFAYLRETNNPKLGPALRKCSQQLKEALRKSG
jgi:hypothetical protein